MLSRALVIRFSALGDVLHTTPVVRALAAAGVSADYLTDPGSASLVEGQPNIREVILYDRHRADRGLAGLWRLASRLRTRRYDAIVDLHPRPRTFLLAMAVGAGQKIRYLRYRKDRVGTPRHVVDNFVATLAPLGLSAPEARPGGSVAAGSPSTRLHFAPGPAARQTVETALAAAGVPPGTRLVALHMRASVPLKNWSPARFGMLAARVAARPGVRVVFTDAAVDRLFVEEAKAAAAGAWGVARRLPLVDLAGQLDMPALGALFARCAVVVAPDTGPLHLATAVGAKTVAIFGPSDPLRTGPVGEGHRVVQADLDCVPCRNEKWTCRRVDRPHACMEDLTVEAVEAAVRAVLEPSAAVAR